MGDSKVAIVTGGAHGIGGEISRSLLAQNWRIIIADKNPVKMEWKDKDRFLIVKTDVSREVSVRSMIRQTIERFGQIDAVINNAGVLPKKKLSIEKMPLSLWQEFINTNLTGCFLTAKYAIPHLRKRNGDIINIASTRFLQSEGDGDEAYSASKGGVVSFTHALAVSLGPDIRVNCISPGWIHTEKTKLTPKDHKQHPYGRVGEPQDIASMVSFLLNQGTFITGQNFIIDGGMTVKMIYN